MTIIKRTIEIIYIFRYSLKSSINWYIKILKILDHLILCPHYGQLQKWPQIIKKNIYHFIYGNIRRAYFLKYINIRIGWNSIDRALINFIFVYFVNLLKILCPSQWSMVLLLGPLKCLSVCKIIFSDHEYIPFSLIKVFLFKN